MRLFSRCFMKPWMVWFLAVSGVPSIGAAFDSGAGISLGDLGSDFRSGQEVFLFPQGLFNVDERMVLQFVHTDSPYRALEGSSLFEVGVDLGKSLYNSRSEEMGNGAGFVISPMQDLQLGVWFGDYAPAFGAFIGRGIAATGWTTHVGMDLDGDENNGNETNELKSIDPYSVELEPARKLDLSAAYRFRELDFGLRFWWGSAALTEHPDDHIGPINIYETSGASVGVESNDPYSVKEGRFALSEVGVGAGVGFVGIEGVRMDFGLRAGFLGSSYTPNGIERDFFDGFGHDVQTRLRATVQVNSTLEVGGAVGYRDQSMSFSPLLQRDGGELVDFDDVPFGADGQPIYLDPPGAPGSRNTLPGPGDCTDPAGQYTEHHGPQGLIGSKYAGNELCPVLGVEYEEELGQWDATLLARYRPTSRVTLYGAVGLGATVAHRKAGLRGDSWYVKRTVTALAVPYIRGGFAGQVTEWLDVMMGVHRRWQTLALSTEGFDARIPPKDELGPLSDGTTPVGNENNVNANRRLYTAESSVNGSVTQSMMGLRAHHKGVALVAHLDTDVLFNGLYGVFGKEASGTPMTWVNLIYDWDYLEDGTLGNGLFVSPHVPEAAASEEKAARSGNRGVAAEELDFGLDEIVDSAVEEEQKNPRRRAFPPRRD